MRLDKGIIELLRNKLKTPLPGEAAHRRLAPPYRPRLTPEEIKGNNPKKSGVMLLLYEKNEELYLVLTQRIDYAGVHGGQMSFPGGKKDEEDGDIVQTALRETREEIGISAAEIDVLGQLSELYIPPSNFLVNPVVGYAKKITRFVPNEKEVAQIVEIPLAFFMNAANVNMQTEIKVYTGNTVTVPAYIFEKHIIWGATAIILSEFTTVLHEITGE